LNPALKTANNRLKATRPVATLGHIKVRSQPDSRKLNTEIFFS